MFKLRRRRSKEEQGRIKVAEGDMRNCIRWLRGGGAAPGLHPIPFNMQLMAFDLERDLADFTGQPRPEPLDPTTLPPDAYLMINKSEAEALLFHYHKHGIPVSQIAAKRLEKRLCDWLGKETKDDFIPKDRR